MRTYSENFQKRLLFFPQSEFDSWDKPGAAEGQPGGCTGLYRRDGKMANTFKTYQTAALKTAGGSTQAMQSDPGLSEKVRLAIEACQKRYDDVNQGARLACYVAGRYAPDREEYKWAMKNLAEDMANEREELAQFQKLAQGHPQDPYLVRELQRVWMSFTTQQVQIMKELCNTSISFETRTA
jgi:hypothetical protein